MAISKHCSPLLLCLELIVCDLHGTRVGLWSAWNQGRFVRICLLEAKRNFNSHIVITSITVTITWLLIKIFILFLFLYLSCFCSCIYHVYFLVFILFLFLYLSCLCSCIYLVSVLVFILFLFLYFSFLLFLYSSFFVFLCTGHCYDSLSGNPPRGLQFILGSNSTPAVFDTIVMANLVRSTVIQFVNQTYLNKSALCICRSDCVEMTIPPRPSSLLFIYFLILY